MSNTIDFGNKNLNNINNISVATTGDINVLKINSLYHQNLSVASGIGTTDIVLMISDPSGTPTTQVLLGSTLRSSLLDQPAVLRLRQGTDAERLLITPASGEPIWTTDTQKLYVGDGTTLGGDLIGPSDGSSSPYSRPSGIESILVSNSGCSISNGSDYSAILSGRDNVIANSGDYNVVVGGRHNKINSLNNGNVIVGGGATDPNNQVSLSSYGNTIGVSGAITAKSAKNCSIINGSRNKIGTTVGGYYTENNTILGGYINTINQGYNCAILGGFNNTLSAYNNCAILNGSANSITNYRNDSTILGGAFNSITVSNGIICGGNTNLVSSESSCILGGILNSATTGSYSVIGGGSENTAIAASATGYITIPGGFRAKATRYGELTHAAGRFGNNGDAQHTILIPRRSTTDATADVVLTLAGGTPSSTNRLTIPAKTTWAFNIKVSAYNDTDSEGAWWIINGGIRRNGSNGTALVGSLVTDTGADSSLSTASVSVVADDTNEALEIRVTGVASKNIRWVAVVDLCQVSYGTP